MEILKIIVLIVFMEIVQYIKTSKENKENKNLIAEHNILITDLNISIIRMVTTIVHIVLILFIFMCGQSQSDTNIKIMFIVAIVSELFINLILFLAKNEKIIVNRAKQLVIIKTMTGKTYENNINDLRVVISDTAILKIYASNNKKLVELGNYDLNVVNSVLNITDIKEEIYGNDIDETFVLCDLDAVKICWVSCVLLYVLLFKNIGLVTLEVILIIFALISLYNKITINIKENNIEIKRLFRKTLNIKLDELRYYLKVRANSVNDTHLVIADTKHNSFIYSIKHTKNIDKMNKIIQDRKLLNFKDLSTNSKLSYFEDELKYNSTDKEIPEVFKVGKYKIDKNQLNEIRYYELNYRNFLELKEIRLYDKIGKLKIKYKIKSRNAEYLTTLVYKMNLKHISQYR